MLIGVGQNKRNIKVRQFISTEEGIVEKNNLASFLVFYQDEAGYIFAVPITQADLLTFKNINTGGIYALTTDLSRVITARENGKQVLVGHGCFKI